MSFIDDIIGFGKNLIGSNSIGADLAKTALLGLALNRLTESINSDNTSATAAAAEVEIDRGVRLQLEPDAQHSIPVVYGSAYLGGIVTDAAISNNNLRMHYVITIAEQTGIKLSDSQASVISFKDIYLDDQRCVFDSDGVTVAYTTDRDGNIDYSADGLIKIYCYSGSSADPVVPEGYTNGSLSSAWSVMPDWTVNHTMDELIFAIVEVNYNRDKGITALPTVLFHMENSMSWPGDCLYDYMTNTRYGAGIADQEIYKQ